MTEPTGTERLVGPTTKRLASMHRAQVHRDPWPAWSTFDPGAHPKTLRRAAAVQWAGRARAEHGSVQQFSTMARAACEAQLPTQVLGALSRLITDEVRHAELCAEMALCYYPEGRTEDRDVFSWDRPTLPWPEPPLSGTHDAQLAWIAAAALDACCLGETLSKPMLEAITVVSTDELAAGVARQILRDEHLHAQFGFELLGLLLPLLDPADRDRLEAGLPQSLRAYEASTNCGIEVDAIAGQHIEIAKAGPNLGTLGAQQYAFITYATFESEILPELEALGLPAWESWRRRGQAQSAQTASVSNGAS